MSSVCPAFVTPRLACFLPSTYFSFSVCTLNATLDGPHPHFYPKLIQTSCNLVTPCVNFWPRFAVHFTPAMANRWQKDTCIVAYDRCQVTVVWFAETSRSLNNASSAIQIRSELILADFKKMVKNISHLSDFSYVGKGKKYFSRFMFPLLILTVKILLQLWTVVRLLQAYWETTVEAAGLLTESSLVRLSCAQNTIQTQRYLSILFSSFVHIVDYLTFIATCQAIFREAWCCQIELGKKKRIKKKKCSHLPQRRYFYGHVSPGQQANDIHLTACWHPNPLRHLTRGIANLLAIILFASCKLPFHFVEETPPTSKPILNICVKRLTNVILNVTKGNIFYP